MKKKLVAALLTSLIVLPIGAAIAKNEMKGHPNLIAAQSFVHQAYEKLVAAQKANEYDLQGHAKKAEDNLKLAVDEINMAAAAANENKDKK